MKREFSIDILKFIATLAIFNHCSGPLYGAYSFMATGGALGVALFFFCSGYALMLGRVDRFDNWFKRRLSRVWPTAFVVVGVETAMGRGGGDIMEAFLGGGWFVTYILIAYMAFYIIRRFHMPLWGALCGNIIIVALLYFDLPFEKGYVLFRNYAIKGFVLFIFMLIGAMLSSTQKKGGASSRWPMVAFLLSFGVFNVLAILISNRFISSKVQVLVILPLIGAVIALYWVASSVCDKIKNGAGRDVILVVGGLCLELYLTYGLVRTTLFNAIFPLNIAINLMIGLLCAYLTRCLSRMFRQTFNAGNYDWGSVVRLKP